MLPSTRVALLSVRHPCSTDDERGRRIMRITGSRTGMHGARVASSRRSRPNCSSLQFVNCSCTQRCARSEPCVRALRPAVQDSPLRPWHQKDRLSAWKVKAVRCICVLRCDAVSGANERKRGRASFAQLRRCCSFGSVHSKNVGQVVKDIVSTPLCRSVVRVWPRRLGHHMTADLTTESGHRAR